MSVAALARLEQCHEALIGALDGNDIDAVENGIAELRAAAEAVRAVGAWTENNEVRDRSRRIAALAEAARVRVNFLTDRNADRADRLDVMRRGYAAGAYRRDGRR